MKFGLAVQCGSRTKFMPYCFSSIDLNLSIGDRLRLKDDPSDRLVNNLLAQSECEDVLELVALLSLMQNMGLIQAWGEHPAGGDFWPSAEGWKTIEQLQLQAQSSSQAFVAMWFDSSLQEAYDKGFYRAIYNLGYDPLRIDRKEHINKIDDEIIAEIRRSGRGFHLRPRGSPRRRLLRSRLRDGSPDTGYLDLPSRLHLRPPLRHSPV
jgi:hypothetical protein